MNDTETKPAAPAVGKGVLVLVGLLAAFGVGWYVGGLSKPADEDGKRDPNTGLALSAQVEAVNAGKRVSLVDDDVTYDDIVEAVGQLKEGSRVRLLDFPSPQLEDAGLEKLASIQGVQEVNFSDSKVTGKGLAHLAEYTEMERLWLNRTRVRGGLDQLKAPGLLELRLRDTDVDDEALAALTNFPKLRFLSLAGTRAGNATAERIGQLAELEELRLGRTAVDDDGLASLAGLTELRRLSLNGLKVTNAGLEHLSGLQGLEELLLEYTSVDDDGLATLAKLPNLEVVALAGTKVTGAGIESALADAKWIILYADATQVDGALLAKLTESHPDIEISVEEESDDDIGKQ